ncbi:MAG TPA: hypothetical protein PLS49_00045 [Candidatus Woesebacteria bacterium]|nr:hypothetical protein [Candidatus Woesebacteria bacterium]
MYIHIFYAIFDLIQFLLLFFISFYIPGRIIVNKFLPHIEGLEQKVLSIAGGIAFFLVTSYALAWLGYPMLQYFVILVGVVIYALCVVKRDSIDLSKNDSRLLIVVLVGSVSAVLLTAFSGMLTDVGVRFSGINAADGIVHIARIKNQINNFPPTHPGLAGIEFRGYHYFYDFLISRFVLLFGSSPENLYFRYFSFLSAFLFGTGLVIFAKKLTSNFWAISLMVLFGFFGTGGGAIINILQPTFSASVSRSLSLIYDPSIYFSLGMLFSALVVLPQTKSWRRALFVAMILGVLAQIKIYVGLLGIVALVSYTVYHFFKYKRKDIRYYIGINFVTAIITALTFLPNNLGAGQMVFAPFLFYSHFIQQPYFANWHWEIKRQIFADHNNYLRIVILYIQAFVVFWILILEFKLLTFLKAPVLLKQKFWKNDYNFLLAIIFLTAFFIPSFFIQSISVFDIGQFFWILLILFSIPFSMVLWTIIEKFKHLGVVVVTLIVVISIVGGFYQNVSMNLTSDIVADRSESKLLSEISGKVTDNQFIIVIPHIKEDNLVWRGHSLVAALTGKPVYYEDQIIMYALDDIYSERKQNLLDLHKGLKNCDIESIEKISSSIGSKNLVTYRKYPCLEQEGIVSFSDHATNLHFYILK